jgi:Resolvase, N terminal domain
MQIGIPVIPERALSIILYRERRDTIMASTAVITYIRVSTSQQGRSGLGIEAQRQSLHQFAKAEGLELVREFVEVETGISMNTFYVTG